MTFAPRDYQLAAVDAVERYFDSGRAGSPLVEVPTGGGKSAIIGLLVRRAVEEWGIRVAVVTHRKELIEQDERAITSVWPDAPIGIYSAGLASRDVNRITIAGVQSVAKKAHVLGRVQLMIIDEAHLVSPDDGTSYHRLISSLREDEDMRLVGLTATPYRLGQGMLTSGKDRLFDSICYRVEVRDLIKRGYLAPLVSGAASASIDLSDVGVRGGEYMLGDMELAADVEQVTDAVADDVASALQSGRRAALVYGVSVAHAAHLRNAIRFRGISCETVSGETPPAERRDILDRIKGGRLSCITSCDVLTTGFDAPIVDVLAVVRATQSPGLYVQIMGRGMRTYPGKTDCLVYDYGANVARHGPIDAVRTPKEGGSGGDGAIVKLCSSCAAEVPSSTRVCPYCDTPFPIPMRKATTKASPMHPLSGGDPKVRRVRSVVGAVEVYRHVKRSGDGPPTMRVDYYPPTSPTEISAKKICSEWVCIEHTGYARDRAERWWAATVGGPCPVTVSDALREWDRRTPTITAIVTSYDGQWLRVEDRDVTHADPPDPTEWDDDKMAREEEGMQQDRQPDDVDPFGDDFIPF